MVGSTDQLHRRFVAGGHRVGHLVDGAVEAADALEPPEDVHAAVAAGQSGVAADGKNDVAAGAGSSSASCTPVAEAPTTSTPPAGSASGLRYAAGVTWAMPGSRPLAIAGTAGRSHQPVAITTSPARQRRWW